MLWKDWLVSEWLGGELGRANVDVQVHFKVYAVWSQRRQAERRDD